MIIAEGALVWKLSTKLDCFVGECTIDGEGFGLGFEGADVMLGLVVGDDHKILAATLGNG